MSEVTVAVVQMGASWELEENRLRAERLVEEAATDGAQVILLPELFETPYFCQEQSAAHFRLAHNVNDSDLLRRFVALAKRLGVVLPLSFFERVDNVYYNSLAVIDADGTILGVYRKSHIPDGPGYQEKFYFTPGDTGFRVWKTRFGTLGFGICWDQWFPECARVLVLSGAELLLYPTAIGSEPEEPELDTRAAWQRVMQGHAAANCVPVAAANRVGRESTAHSTIDFYGSSFLTDAMGRKVAEADRQEETILTARFDFEGLREQRAAWGFFRDRRPDLYRPLLGLYGVEEDES